MGRLDLADLPVSICIGECRLFDNEVVAIHQQTFKQVLSLPLWLYRTSSLQAVHIFQLIHLIVDNGGSL